MKVQSKDITKMQHTVAEIHIGSDDGAIVIRGKNSVSGKWEKRISESDAVCLWRCLTGETFTADVCIVGESGCHLHLEYREKSKDWKLFDVEQLAFFTADEAMALAWALKACVTESMLSDTRSPVKEIILSRVWVLSHRTVLMGDAVCEGVEMVGGSTSVFSSKEKALDALREYMRPLVNDAETEDHWENCGQNVDDVLDDILERKDEEANGVRHWYYEGVKQAFEVTLTECGIDTFKLIGM